MQAVMREAQSLGKDIFNFILQFAIFACRLKKYAYQRLSKARSDSPQSSQCAM
jgi:hypothetical protein